MHRCIWIYRWYIVKYIIYTYMALDQNLYIPFLGGWTSIYQLFRCSPGVQGFDTLPNGLSYLLCKQNLGVQPMTPSWGTAPLWLSSFDRAEGPWRTGEGNWKIWEWYGMIRTEHVYFRCSKNPNDSFYPGWLWTITTLLGKNDFINTCKLNRWNSIYYQWEFQDSGS